MTDKQRTCLKCGKKFNSTGPGNRICKSCARVNKLLAVPWIVLQTQRGVKRHNGVIVSSLEYNDRINRAAE